MTITKVRSLPGVGTTSSAKYTDRTDRFATSQVCEELEVKRQAEYIAAVAAWDSAEADKYAVPAHPLDGRMF